MKNSLLRTGLLGLLISAGFSHAGEVPFGARASAVNAVLDALPNGDTEAAFTARMSRVRDDFVGRYALREQVQVSFSAEADLYLNIAYVDAQGILTIMQLDLGSGAGRLEGGRLSTFTGEDLETHPPLGLERAYYVATRNPPDQSAFNPLANTGGGANMFSSADPVKLARNFVASVLQANSPSEVSTVALDSLVIERKEGPRYAFDEIVRFYFERGMFGIDGVRLESGILFDSGSAELSEAAKLNLDEWGKAFQQPEIADFHFEIGGHTDGTGSDEYKRQLSYQRAKSVFNYLLSKFEISGERFTLVGHGETQPVVENTGDVSRAPSHKVEFYLRLDTADPDPEPTGVVLETSMGDIEIEVD